MNYMLTLADISGETWAEDLTSVPKLLGRSESVDIRLDHSSVSRQHCRFWVEGASCYVEDCGSTNGTYVNGKRIQRQRLVSGDTVIVGRFELIVEDKDISQATADFPERPTSRVSLIDQRSEEKHLARVIHQRLTPCRRMSLPGLIIEVQYSPSGMLGGDCFDGFELNNRWILSLFDPMNHGVKAAMNSMLLRAELQRWVSLTAEPGRCLQWINSELALLGVNDLYVSAVVASWFPRTQTLVYATAGEYPPLVLHDGKVRNPQESAGGLPLGVQAGERYSEHLVQLKTGDRVYFFTDGVSQALGDGSSGGGLARELAESIQATAKLSLPEQMHAILSTAPAELVDDVLLAGCEVMTH